MKGKTAYFFTSIIGLACAICGLFVLTDAVVSGLCIGAGSAAFALGLGNFILLIALPEAARQERQRVKNIEANDERNIRIREKAGAAANRIIFYALCAAALTFGLLKDLLAVLVVTGILLMEFVLFIVFTGRYSKQI